MSSTFFSKPSEFRSWLQKNHQKETELSVGFYKTGSGKPSITWSQSVDEALCFGWIDGVRKSINEESYCIRFTPRKPTSNWSAININKMKELAEKGLMQSAGLAAFELRKESKSKIYSYENEPVKLDRAFEKQFKANKKAWAFFKSQAPWYQRTVIHQIMRAKQDATKIKRLEKLIQYSEEGKRI